MKQNNIEVTNEELARMIKEGFDHVDERFTKVDVRFDETKSDIADLRNDVDDLKKDVTDMSYKVNQIDRCLFSLEEDIYETKRKQHDKLDSRVTFIERKLGIKSSQYLSIERKS